MLHQAIAPSNHRLRNFMSMYYFHWRCKHYISLILHMRLSARTASRIPTQGSRAGQTTAAIGNVFVGQTRGRFFTNQQTLAPVSRQRQPWVASHDARTPQTALSLINGGGGGVVEHCCLSLCTITVRFPALSTQRRATSYDTQSKAQWLYYLAFAVSPRL